MKIVNKILAFLLMCAILLSSTSCFLFNNNDPSDGDTNPPSTDTNPPSTDTNPPSTDTNPPSTDTNPPTGDDTLNPGTDIEVIQAALKTIYNSPATDWQSETLALGNGFLGASIFGGVNSDRILINEHSIWSGGPGADADYDGGKSDATAEENHANLQAAREKLAEILKEFSESYTPGVGANNTQNYPALSDELNTLINSLKGEKTNFGAYQELGSIYIEDGISYPVISSYGNLDVNASQNVNKIFDGKANTKWYSLAGTPSGTTQSYPVWAQIETESAITVSSYGITSAADVQNRDPSKWTLMGSNDGIDWNTVDTQQNVSFSARNEELKFNLSKPETYRYWRLQIESVRGTNYGVQIAEVVFYDENGGQISWNTPTGETNYIRSLNLDEAIASVSYNLGGINYYREYFVSNPGNFMAVRLTADKTGALNKLIKFASAQTNIKVTANGNTITVTGSPKDHVESEKLLFAFQVKVVTDGNLITNSDSISVTGATKIELYMTAGTNYQQCMDDSFDYFTDEDPLNAVKARLAAIKGKSYEELKVAHIADYKELFDRVKISLPNAYESNKMTDELLEGYRNGTNSEAENRYLESVYYQYGRYLLIASSREGSLPANLQGIWAEGLTPAWNSDYHTNINIQMNYWPAEQTNLSECHQPMIDYINSLVERGKLTAQTYHVNENGNIVRGWTTYHENNIWGNTHPGTSGAFYFPTGAAWLCQHIWEQYAFTLDKAALQESYETLKLASLFWVDNLVTDPRDGKLVSSPSRSPEHGPYSLGCSADQVMIWELFNNTLKAAEVLGDNSSEIAEIKEAMDNLALPEIGVNGQYMEWRDEVSIDVTGDNGHRHVNHLFALHPGTLVVAGRSDEDDAFIEAIRQTLEIRGDSDIGWSIAWKMNFWARMRDGDRAGLMVDQILKNNTFDNLFDTCYSPASPPFEIDGNFGATSGMTEMFLQSQGDSIDLLPALPTMWYGSAISGLVARGNIEVDIESDANGILKKAVLKPAADNSALKVRSLGLGQFSVKTMDGKAVEVNVIDEDTLVFAVKAGEIYVIEANDNVDAERSKTYFFNVAEKDPFLNPNGGNVSIDNDATEKVTTDNGTYYQNTRGTRFTTTINASKATNAKLIISINSTNKNTYKYTDICNQVVLNGETVKVNDGTVTTLGWNTRLAQRIAIADLSLKEGKNEISFLMGNKNINISAVSFELEAGTISLCGPYEDGDSSAGVLDMYVIIGQSNAGGYSRVDTVTNPKDVYSTGFENIYYYGKGDNNIRQSYKDIVKFGYGTTTACFGSEIGIADMISQYNPGNESLIFKYARGGSFLTDNITHTNPIKYGNWCPPSMITENSVDGMSGVLYNDFITMLKEAIALYESNGYTVNLKGTFWMQGEAEAGAGTQYSDDYEGHLRALISDVRAEYSEIFGEYATETPFVIGKICPTFHGGGLGVAAVRDIQEYVARTTDNVYFVETNDYLLINYETNKPAEGCNDTSHFCGDDMLSLGKDVGEAILENSTPTVKIENDKTHSFTVADNDPFIESKGGSFGSALYKEHDSYGVYYESTKGVTFTTKVTVSQATEAKFIVKLARGAGKTHKISELITSLTVNGESVTVSSESITSTGWENAIDAVVATISLKAGVNTISFTRDNTSGVSNFNVCGITYVADENVELDLGYHTFDVTTDDPFAIAHGGSVIKGTKENSGDVSKQINKYGTFYQLTSGATFVVTIDASKATTADFVIRINSTNGKTYAYDELIDAITVNTASVTLNDGSVTTAGWYTSSSVDVRIAALSLAEGTNVIIIDMGETGVNIASIVLETEENVDLSLVFAK